MNKKILVILSTTVVMLSSCKILNVDNSVDNSQNNVNSTVDKSGYIYELSTEECEYVDDSVDNSKNQVENTMSDVELPVEGVFSEAVSQAREYFYYYATECSLHGIESDLLFSETKFKKAWIEEEEKTLEDYFNITGWYDRGEYFSLQFDPKDCLFDRNCKDVYQWMARCIKGFLMAKDKYSCDELWGNEESLIPQYHCHSLYAGSKKRPWYIEPHRTETNFLIILSAKGNPDPK